MPPSEFDENRKALVVRLSERAKSTDQLASEHWSEINSGRFDFRRSEREAAALQSITLQDILAFYDRYLLAQSPVRRKLTVRVYPNALDNSNATELRITDAESVLIGDDVVRFKQTMELYPTQQPVVNVLPQGAPIITLTTDGRPITTASEL